MYVCMYACIKLLYIYIYTRAVNVKMNGQDYQVAS